MILNIESLTDLSGFHVVFNGTIKNEKKGNRGISHIIEHLICKNFDDLLDEFEKNGISWNAYTSDTKIVFYITGLFEYLHKFKDRYLERILDFKITQEDFENEKKIILEEYSDTFNKQSSAHFLNLYRKLFDNYNPIGDVNDIENITLEDCIEYRNKYYTNPTMIINVSRYNKYRNNSIKFNNFDNNYNTNYLKNNKFEYQKTNIFKSKTSIIYLSPVILDNYPLVNFTTALLSNGLKSPLYQEVREKNGLVYYINCYLDHITDNSSIVNISSETKDNKIDEFYEKVKYVLDNKEKFITQDRFDIVKQSFDIMYRKSDINRYSNINKYVTPKKWLIEPIIGDIKIEQIYDIYDKYFNIDNYYISYDKKEF